MVLKMVGDYTILIKLYKPDYEDDGIGGKKTDLSFVQEIWAFIEKESGSFNYTGERLMYNDIVQISIRKPDYDLNLDYIVEYNDTMYRIEHIIDKHDDLLKLDLIKKWA